MALNGGRVAECSENQPINRYELDLVQKNAKLESDIALRDANAYNDQKALEMYKYIDGRLRGIDEDFRPQFFRHAVHGDAVVALSVPFSANSCRISYVFSSVSELATTSCTLLKSK